MAARRNYYRELLLRAHKDVRAALKDCDELLDRTRRMLEPSRHDDGAK